MSTLVGVSPPAVDSTGICLSISELNVARLLLQGDTNREIAQALHLSPRTVQSHVANAMAKAGAKSRTHLAVLVLRAGLLADPPTPTAGGSQ